MIKYEIVGKYGQWDQAAMAEIVRLHPHIDGINFDLPHAVAIAPAWPALRHVGGDMIDGDPSSDVVFMKATISY